MKNEKNDEEKISQNNLPETVYSSWSLADLNNYLDYCKSKQNEKGSGKTYDPTNLDSLNLSGGK